jgi:hypothetical protein
MRQKGFLKVERPSAGIILKYIGYKALFLHFLVLRAYKVHNKMGIWGLTFPRAYIFLKCETGV